MNPPYTAVIFILQQQHMVNLNQNANIIWTFYLLFIGLTRARLVSFVFGVCRPVLVIVVTVVINCQNVCYI